MSFVPHGFEKVCSKTKTHPARPIYAVFSKSLTKKKLMIKFQIINGKKYGSVGSTIFLVPGPPAKVSLLHKVYRVGSMLLQTLILLFYRLLKNITKFRVVVLSPRSYDLGLCFRRMF